MHNVHEKMACAQLTFRSRGAFIRYVWQCYDIAVNGKAANAVARAKKTNHIMQI